jgi:hypothetical protein
MKIVGDNATVEINILRKAHPESKDTWDQQWFITHVKAFLDGFQACFETCVMRHEFDSFIDSISNTLDTQQGMVEFSTLEEALHLKGTVDYTGNIEWIGLIIYPIGTGSKLHFEFKTDFYQLQRIKDSLTRELSVY